MRSPDINLSSGSLAEISEDKGNGRGYWMFLPQDPAMMDDTLPYIGDFSDFTEMPEIMDELQRSRSVLVEGAPGSGKSHLVRNLQVASVVNNLPTFCLTMHINGGNRHGARNIQPPLKEFTEATAKNGGLVILDNVDIIGYRGSGKRPMGRTRDYAQDIQPVVQELLDNPSLAVLGTAHDAAWREGQWTWLNEEIDGPAHAALDGFRGRYAFEGKMALVGLAHLMRERNLARTEGESLITLAQASQAIRKLHRLGRANFFHANHLDVQHFLDDPREAVANIDAGRNERRGGA